MDLRSIARRSTPALVLALGLGASAAEIAPGVAVDPVPCRTDASLSYALYLPSSYAPVRDWPVLYLLDPRGRGAVPLERYRAAAERYGYILVSSNDTLSDGPAQPNYDAMRAMLDDTFARFRIDPRRLYAAGFSGTARAACDFPARLDGAMTAVILVGAGCDPDRRLRDAPSWDVLGVVGTADFNYLEMQEFADTLERSGAVQRLIEFDGAHRWHDAAEADRALEWLELRAIARGLRSDEDGFVEPRHRAALAAARAADEAGDPFAAWSAYRDLATGFAGLRPLDAVEKRSAELARTAEVKRARRQRARLLRRERAAVERVDETLSALFRSRSARPPAAELAWRLDIAKLQAEAAGDPTEDALLARRLLAAIGVRTGFYLPRDLRAAGDEEGAELSEALDAIVRGGE